MNQKEEEKLVMHYFRESYADFPKGRLLASESPDFILKISPKKSIGIELTQLYSVNNFFNDLKDLVHKKEIKVPLYRNIHLTEMWLLIYADEALNNLHFNLKNKLDKLNLQSRFDRLFLLDLFLKEVYPLDDR